MQLSELIELFNTFNYRNRARRTAEFYREQLAKLLARAGPIDASALRPAHVHLAGGGYHLVVAAKRLLSWAVTEELLELHPLTRMKTPRCGRRKLIVARVHLVGILRKAARDFRDYLLALVQTIARPQEIRELWWEDLFCDGGAGELAIALPAGRAWLLVVDHKGRRLAPEDTGPRLLLISPRLGRLLVRLYRRGVHSGPIFCTRRGKPWTKNAVCLRMRRLRDRCAWLPRRGGEHVVAYTLRHTGATNLAAQGVNGAVLSEVLGHKNAETTARYLHFSPGLIRQAVAPTWARARVVGQKRPLDTK